MLDKLGTGGDAKIHPLGPLNFYFLGNNNPRRKGGKQGSHEWYHAPQSIRSVPMHYVRLPFFSALPCGAGFGPCNPQILFRAKSFHWSGYFNIDVGANHMKVRFALFTSVPGGASRDVFSGTRAKANETNFRAGFLFYAVFNFLLSHHGRFPMMFVLFLPVVFASFTHGVACTP